MPLRDRPIRWRFRWSHSSASSWISARPSAPAASIARAWRTGDVIEVKYAMRLRSAPAGENRIAYSFGPWLLGAPAAENLAYFNEMTIENKLVRGKEEARLPSEHTPRRFSVPVAATTCQYVAAEFPDQAATVELRAIAEQTGQPTTSWELRFLTEEHG